MERAVEPGARRVHPAPNALTRPFWQACREHRLIVQQCDDCGRRWFTPEAACIHCASLAWTWHDGGGIGTVYSYTIVHRAPGPGFEVPFALAAVDLDDGYTMMTHIVGCPPDDVAIGMRVSVRFVDVDNELTLPCFGPL